MRGLRWSPWPLSACAALVAAPAIALEPGSVAGQPVRVDVSESSSVYYNFDNRDTKPSQVATRANDNFGLVYNRLNVQGTAGNLSLGVRVDNVWFYTSPNVTELALDMTRETTPSDPPGYFRRKLGEAGLELSNRFIDWMYPSKYYLTYSSSSVEATLGEQRLRDLDQLLTALTARHPGARSAHVNIGALGLVRHGHASQGKRCMRPDQA